MLDLEIVIFVRRDEMIWTPEEVARASELIQVMSAAAAAIRLSEETDRKITRSALISKLNRARYGGPTFNPAHTIGCTISRNASGEPKKKRVSTSKAPKDYSQFKTKRWGLPKISTKREPLSPRYLPKWTCQYIGDVPGMCGKESHGPWCDEHKQIVTQRK